MMLQAHSHDVIVVGGGPAGSTTAALLAEAGHDVLVLEKSQFPRYHVGESLMPFCWFTLDRLGLTDWLNQSDFPKKHSVQFVRPDGSVSAPFYFFQHTDHPCATTWQVDRDVFDTKLLDNAAAKGATVRYNTNVRELIEDETGRIVGVRALDESGEKIEPRARIVVDATGRDAFAATRFAWRQRDPQLSKISIWTIYNHAKRDPGLDEGATTVAYIPQRGWFWYIPLKGDRVSVGIVAERDYLYREGKDPEKIFQREIQENAWIADHLAPGEQVGQYWVTGDYSYRSKYTATDGLVMVGDAFGFLDPVFSSGVFLALKSGELAADTIDAALKDGDVSAERFNEYSESVCRAIEAMRQLVYAFYDEGFSFGRFIKKYPHLRSDLTDLLIGDLVDGHEELLEKLKDFAETPAALNYGRAKVTSAVGSSS